VLVSFDIYEEKSILPIVRLNAAKVLKSTYVGRPFHALITRRKCDYIYLTVYYCVLFSSRVRVRIRVRIRFSVWFVSCCAHVFVQL